MHRPRAAIGFIATIPLLFAPPLAAAEAPDALERARALMSRGQARDAVAVLEDALPEVSAAQDRAGLLGLLRQAYARAADQADAAGQAHDAETFRDNLQILNRKASKATAKPVAEPAPAPGPAEAGRPVDPPATANLQRLDPEVRPASVAEDLGTRLVPSSTPSLPPSPAPGPAKPVPVASIPEGDAAFVAKRYDDAGTIYATLAREGKLPKTRRDHWAYCRWVEVVRRINARPSTPQEWESIDAEIQRIRELSPNNWYGEYLRSRAAERAPGRRASRSNKIVVRGSAPEEPASASPPDGQGPRPEPAASGETGRNGGSIGRWQVLETANFRILHADPALAGRVAEAAESARGLQLKRWAGTAARPSWSPRCDIYVYPNSGVFARMTGQPEESPGFSTMGMNAGRIVARRVNVRADHADLLKAILPHEITHVVLADLFPHQQIPRWADEGMAVLSEPVPEQRRRAADLEKPLNTGQLFKVNDLMVMDYPDGRYWGLYYAQSVSLTRFLVEQGTPAQFIEFVQGSQRNGLEAELRRVYKIAGLADLQARWLDYAKAKSGESTATASTDGSAKGTETERQ